MTTLQKNILVIDDDETLREYIQLLLEDEGYTVYTAENGIIGLNIFSQNNFDLIITDLIMPEKEGLETIQDIRKKDPNCGIIAMSGASNKSSYLNISSALGADAVLHKPFGNEALLNIVRNTLKSKNSTA